jgi:hypothetical protein
MLRVVALSVLLILAFTVNVCMRWRGFLCLYLFDCVGGGGLSSVGSGCIINFP